MVAHRPDWCISRQRVWGVPIVAFYCTACEALLLDEAVIEHVAAIFREGQGADEWYARPAAELLPPGTRVRPAAAGPTSARKATSSTCGSTPAAATPPCWRRGPSSAGPPRCTWRAPTSTAAGSTRRCWRRWARASAPPYRSVLTHGFVVDGDGRKMSKSLGNYVTQEELLPKYGAEVLRLWVAAEDYTEDIRLSGQILDRLADAYRRIRNTYRFLLGNLADFDPARDRQPYARLDEVDRFILDRLARLIARVRRAYDEYQFHTAFHAVHNFCAVDLSALYLDIIKDRLYTSAPGDPASPRGPDHLLRDPLRARAAHGAHPQLHRRGGVASAARGPRRQRAPRPVSRGASPSGSTTPSSGSGTACWRCDGRWPRPWRRPAWPVGWTPRATQGLAIGSGLEAIVRILASPEDLPDLLRRKQDLLPTLFIVSQVTFEPKPDGSLVHHPEPGHPRTGDRRRPGAGAEVRALLALQRARRRASRASDALRALPPGGARAVVIRVVAARGDRDRPRPADQGHRAGSPASGRAGGVGALALAHPRHESRPGLRRPRRRASRLAMGRGGALAGRPRRPGAGGAPGASCPRMAGSSRGGPDLRGRGGQSHRSRALGRRRRLRRRALAGLSLAGLQRGRLRHHRGGGACSPSASWPDKPAASPG